MSESDALDLDYLVNIVEESGYEIYIRDNSYLGFPSFHVVIPGMSEITTALGDSFLKELIKFEQNLDEFYKWPAMGEKQRLELLKNVEEFRKNSYSGRFMFADYYRHLDELNIGDDDFIEILKSGSIDYSRDFPVCFNCATCYHSKYCKFEHFTTLWDKLKTGHSKFR